MAARTISVESGPAGWPRGAVGEAELARLLDSLIEIKPGRKPANFFLVLLSPHRNGNTEFLGALSPLIGRGRMVATLAVPQSEGVWDSAQYPRLIEGLLPAYRTSQRFRDRFRLHHASFGQRLAFFAVDFLLPVVAFLAVEVVFAMLLSDWPGGAGGSGAGDPLRRLALVPAWAHGAAAFVAVAIELLQRKRALLLETLLGRERREPGYQLEKDDRSFLTGGATAEYGPLLAALRQALPGASIITVDRADGLDELSETVLLRFLFSEPERQQSNRLVLLQVPDRSSHLYRKLKRECSDLARPEEIYIELRLHPVALEDRKRIAACIGKSERDAMAAPLVADLVQSDTPRIVGLRTTWRQLVREETDLPAGSEPGPALLLALLASAGAGGPRQFGFRELRQVLTRQESTFGRWTAAFGKRPWFPHTLESPLAYLTKVSELPLVESREPVRGDPQWVVGAEVRRVVLDELENAASYLAAAHTFWAVYLHERFETGGSAESAAGSDGEAVAEAGADDPLTKLVALCWQLVRLRLPLSDPQTASVKEQALGRSLLAAVNRALGELFELAQFDRAHALLVRALGELIAIDGLWASAEFVSEVEKLSEHAWRLAAIRGVSPELLRFHKILGERGGRAAAKGIEASVAIWDLYNRGIALEDVDRTAALGHRIFGGDTATRARLENLRSYALNSALMRPHVLVLEGLELLDGEVEAVRTEVLPELRAPVEAPALDIFEHLVGCQIARIHFALGDPRGGVAALRRLVERVAQGEERWDEDDLFAEAVWHLARAEACLVSLEALTTYGPHYLLHLDQEFRDCLALAFGIEPEAQLRDSELPRRLAEEVADALDDAHLFQELCELSLGLACLFGAKVRLGRVLGRMGSAAQARKELASWERGAAITQELPCRALHYGILITRALAHEEIEVCTSCMRSACEEALRKALDGPARRLGRSFAAFALTLENTDLYREAADVLHYSLKGPPPPLGTVEHLEWSDLAVERAQFLRLLNDGEGALAALAPALATDPLAYLGSAHETALSVARRAHLQACWCYKLTGDSTGVARELDLLLAMPEIELWSGYPHLVHQRLVSDVDGKAPVEQAVKIAIRSFARYGVKDRYESRGLLRLGTTLLRAAAQESLQPATRREVVEISHAAVRRVSEWAGIELSVEFLSQALRLPEIDTPALRTLHDDFFAREAMLESRLADLDRQLGAGRPELLLEYVLQRFSHRIDWVDDPDDFALALGKQLKSSGLAGLRHDQVERCIALAPIVSAGDGRLLVRLALRDLLSIQALVAKGVAGPALALGEIAAAIWAATEEILRVVATQDFVPPKLAEAMRTYLKISEAFSKTAAA